MYKLLYIGKSNRRYTHNVIYWYSGNPDNYSNDTYLTPFISVEDNKGSIYQYRKKDIDFFYKHFKFINEQEYLKFQRQQKLKKINESTTP